MNVRDIIKRDEGLSLKSYPDRLTGGAPWTAMYGHTGPEVQPGQTYTQQQAEDTLSADIENATHALHVKLAWTDALDEVRHAVLVSMVFNMGINGLLKFKNTLDACQRGDYAATADGMLGSLWAQQVPKRAARLALMMRTGAWT